MPAISSNTISKYYCPKCGIFDLMNLHRNFMQKHIIGAPNKLQCKACANVIKPGAFESNIPCEVPVFLETPNSGLEVAPASVAEPSSAFVCQEETNHDSDYFDPQEMATQPEESFKVTETVLSEAAEVSISAETSGAGAPRVLHGADEELVDETILTKESKGVWPYMLASVLVLLGAAYAFIWMPIASNVDEIQMDMSIGKPAQRSEETKVSDNLLEAEEEFDEVVTAESRVDAVDVPEKAVDAKLLNESVPEKVRLVLQDPTVNESKENDFRVSPDPGTKADMALGGLSGVNKAKLIEMDTPSEALVKKAVTETDRQVVKVPLLTTSVRQYRVPSTPEKKVEAESSQETANLLEPSKTKVIAPVGSPSKAIISQIAASEPTVSKKKQALDVDAKSVEDVSIKLIQQDLDKLFK